MSLEVLNELAREHNMEERKSVKKVKANLQKVKSEMNSISGKKGKETYKRKREEVEDRQFEWPSPSQSQSQSQGENMLFIDSHILIIGNDIRHDQDGPRVELLCHTMYPVTNDQPRPRARQISWHEVYTVSNY